MAAPQLACAGAGQEKRKGAVVFQQPVDFIQQERKFLNFVDGDQAWAAAEAFPKQSRSRRVFREGIGLKKIDDQRGLENLRKPSTFPDFPRPPKESRFPRGKGEVQESPDNFPHRVILS